MSNFAGISKASISSSGARFQPGRYQVKTDVIKEITSRKGIPLFVVECTILKSTNKVLPVGSSVSWLVNLHNDWALGNVKEFVQALTGDEDSEVTEEAMEDLVGPNQPASGWVVEVDAIQRTSKAGHPWVHPRWRKEHTLTFIQDTAYAPTDVAVPQQDDADIPF